jgi:hypothetical protein
MRVHVIAALSIAVAAMPVAAQQGSTKPSSAKESAPFVYRCLGNARILPQGLAGASKLDWHFQVEPARHLVVMGGKEVAAEIDQYRVSFPSDDNHWISITRSNGRFNLVVPIKNPDHKRPEYLLYEGVCKRPGT